MYTLAIHPGFSWGHIPISVRDLCECYLMLRFPWNLLIFSEVTNCPILSWVWFLEHVSSEFRLGKLHNWSSLGLWFYLPKKFLEPSGWPSHDLFSQVSPISPVLRFLPLSQVVFHFSCVPCFLDPKSIFLSLCSAVGETISSRVCLRRANGR